jgi:multidrug resistance efflux pump
MSDPNVRESQPPTTPGAVALRRARVAEPASQGPRKLASPYPVGLLGQIADLPDDQVLPAALEAVNRLHGGLGCVAFRVEEGLALAAEDEPASGGRIPVEVLVECAVPGAILKERFLHAAGEILRKACEAAASEAAATGEAILIEANLAGGRCLVMAVPARQHGKVTAVLCRAQELQHRGEAASLAAMQAAGLLRLLAEMRGETERIRARFGRVAALIELIGASSQGIDFPECARMLANFLSETFECDLVALSLKTWRGHRVAAVSGETGPAEAHSPGRRAILSHLSESMHQGRALLYRREDHRKGGPASAPVAVPLREWYDPAVSYCLPLVDREGKKRGAWLFVWKSEPRDLDEKRALIEASSPEVAPLLGLLHKAKPGAAVGTVLRLWKKGSISARRLVMVLGGAALFAALLPLPYPVRATCELQPVVRRVIAAPFDGILLRSTVRAGEVVRKGDLLAEMDGRELRSQLAEAIANRERAAKESDQALAEGRVAEARMAAFEAEGLAHEIELLEYRRGHLEVRSPIDGLVLQGDLERSEGAPLRVGDPLFEVGPLERLVAEVAVPATDVPLVRAGAKVTLKLESHATTTVASVIGRVAPKSEWLEEKNVFLCEAEVANPAGDLRAGLKGKAKIEGPRRPLLWNLSRDAWLALRYHFW